MKIGLIYTGITPELKELVERYVHSNLGDEVELLTYQNGEILAKVREAGYVTGEAAALLTEMIVQAMKEGVDAILNLCSSVGEVIDSLQDFGKYCGIPIVRIDEDMCREAVKCGTRIGLIATLPTTLEPTHNTVKRLAREMGKDVTLIHGLVEGAFGLDQEQFKEKLLHRVGEIEQEVDVIVLCQGSMAYCEELIHTTYQKVVLSSPRFGGIGLKEALQKKGVISC